MTLNYEYICTIMIICSHLNNSIFLRHILFFARFRFTIWEEKEAEFHEKLQNLKKPKFFEVSNLRGVVREIKECVTKV